MACIEKLPGKSPIFKKKPKHLNLQFVFNKGNTKLSCDGYRKVRKAQLYCYQKERAEPSARLSNFSQLTRCCLREKFLY